MIGKDLDSKSAVVYYEEVVHNKDRFGTITLTREKADEPTPYGIITDRIRFIITVYKTKDPSITNISNRKYQVEYIPIWKPPYAIDAEYITSLIKQCMGLAEEYRNELHLYFS